MMEEEYDDMENKVIYKEEKKDDKKEELYPNCSEITWRLDVDKNKSIKRKILKALENKKEEHHQTYMAADFPDKFLKEMIDCIKEEQEYCGLDDIKLKMVDDNGENWSFIEEGFRLAKLCLNKEMGRREAKKILEELFEKCDE